MDLLERNRAALLDVPDSEAVLVGTYKLHLSGRKRDETDRLRVLLQRPDELARVRLPQPHRAVVRPARYQRAIRRELDRVHLLRVPLEYLLQLPVLYAPRL